MATRRERVVLELQDDFSTPMARAAAQTALLRGEVERLSLTRINIQVDDSQVAAASREVTRLRAELDAISRTNINARVTQTFTQVTQSGTAARGSINQTGDSINQLTGRLSLLADAALILGPGLVPIAAVGATALGGLATAATAVAVAGGAAVLAFQGVGDAVGAVQEYQLNPTVDGLEKAREAMSKLGPDAQRFVSEFQKVRPVLADIKQSAEAGLFPGLTESLDEMEVLAPRLEEILFNAGQATGFVVNSAAESLVSERWQPFLDVLAEEVPSAIGSIGRIIGDIAHGLSEMMRTFAGNDAFLGWIEDVADGFDNWASSAEATEGIEEIMAYVRQNGPELQALVVSLAQAATAIVQAAAPLGGAVLVGLTAVSEAVRVIAESDMATPLLAAVAALRIFNRLQGVAIAGRGRFTAAMTATPPVAGAGPAPTPLTGAGVYAYRQQQARQAQAAARAQRNRMVAGGAGAAVAGGLLFSGAADDIGLTNTAMLTLAGSMAGPVGAALGAVAGLSMDAAAANNDLTESLEAVNGVIDSGDFTAVTSGLAAAQRELDAFKADMSQSDGTLGAFGDNFDLGKVKNDLEGAFGMSDVEEAEAELARLESRARAGQEAVASLGAAFGMTLGPVDGSARSIEELNGVLEAAKPAMDALGISAQEFLRAGQVDAMAGNSGILGIAARASQDAGLGADVMAEAIRAQAQYMDSAQGKADNYTAALGALVREEGSAAEQARGLNDALDAMVDPALNAEEALSNYREALKEIQNLNADGGFTVKNATGRENLSQTRDFRQDVEARLVTMVEAGRAEEDLARALQNSRQQFIQSGIAAGFSARQMRRRADEIGLTPKLVETTFKAVGLSETDRKTKELRNLFNDLPKNLKTIIREEGAIPSRKRAEELIDKLDLAAKPRKALMNLVTEGEGNIAAAKRLMDSVNSKTVTLTTLVQRSVQRNNVTYTPADGMTLPKTGGAYYDQFPALLAPGEEVISNRYGQADRHRGLLKAINENRMADGGTAGWRVTRNAGDPLAGLRDEADKASGSLKALRAALKDAEKALAAEKQQRQEMLSYRSQVGGSLAGELTGGGLAGLDTGLTANRNDAKAMLEALKKAKAKGLSGPLMDLVAASGDLSLAQQMAELGRAGIAERERQYGSTVAVQNQLGGFAAEQRFGESIAKNKKDIDALAKAIEKGAAAGARKGVGDGTRKAATKRLRDVTTRSRAGR